MQQGYAAPAGVVTVTRNNDHQKTIRGLGITQLIIGGLTFILGLITAVLGIWGYSIAQGIWCGIWILITGIIGVISSKNSNNGCCLRGTYMAFSIVSTVLSSISIIMLGLGLAYYGGRDCSYRDYYPSDDDWWVKYSSRCFDEQSKGLGLYLPMLILMITEFFISIIAAVYCCRSSTCCCAQHQQHEQHVIQTHQQPYQMLENDQGQITGYPVVVSSHPTSYPVANYQPQYAGYPQHVATTTISGQTYSTQMMVSQPQGGQVSAQSNQGPVNPLVSMPNTGAMYVSSQGQAIGGHTNIVYSGQATAQVPNNNAAPPPYNEFSEETKNPAGPLSS